MNVKLTPTINRIAIGNRKVYNAKSFVGNTNTGGNLASLNFETDKTIVGSKILNVIAPKISSKHIFSVCVLSLKNCTDQNGNFKPRIT